MNTSISKASKKDFNESVAYIISNKKEIKALGLSKAEVSYLEKQLGNKQKTVIINQLKRLVAVYFIEKEEGWKTYEQCRNAGNTIANACNKDKHKQLTVSAVKADETYAFLLAEGAALGNYQFLKYYKDKKEKANSLTKIAIETKDTKRIGILQAGVDAVTLSRNLVNEPLSYLTATQFSKEMQKAGKEAGFKVTVLKKQQIKTLKMGGVLGVNRGSQDPPTFNIMEWKPKGAINKKPYVLVGKGIVYDTGGLSLKPTQNSMDHMKCDMAGGAVALGSIYAVAKAKLPVHVIALVPATDNRPGENAYAPGDVLTMFDKTTVEVLNTDAEGRLVLADALAYAKKYKPELVVDFATLTGSAARAVGHHAIVSMGSANEATHSKLKESGFNACERLAELPFWDEYGEQLKSDVADLKNIGGPLAGAITAGKFLEHFTKEKGKHAYPWIHCDIAGPAYLHSSKSYRPKGGTGVGVRLMYDFFYNLVSK